MAEAGDSQPLLTEDIRELLRLIAGSDIAEVLIERGEAKVHIKRALAQPQLVPFPAGAAPHVAAPSVPYAPVIAPPAASTTSHPEALPPAIGVTVTAPMVGTFYASPAPKEPPYVQVGDEVRPGDVLGIIEAMKIMNEIECEVQGRVAEILVEGGQAVEYGQPLMIIEPA
jgi:acetyl-CoA carboxylase biotin carboxyl carrier protein